MKSWALISVCAPLALAGTAVLAAEKLIGFEIGGTELAMPLPAGFCEPSGNIAAFAERMASVDKENKTLATLVACENKSTPAAFQNYFLIKSPYASADLSIGRAEGLDLLEQAMTSPNAPKFTDEMSEQIANETKHELGTSVSITGTFGYAGRDKDCIYLAGPMSGTVNGQTKTGLIATCLTIVGGKMIGVNVYEIPGKTSIAAMKVQARTVALSIRP